MNKSTFRRHGIALIMNNINWQQDPNGDNTRLGAQADAIALKGSLEKIGYKVEYVEDLTSIEMIEKLKEVRSRIDPADDSFDSSVAFQHMEMKMVYMELMEYQYLLIH